MSGRPTVLLVEDDPDLLRFARLTLRLGGYRALTASDGADALALLRRSRPDLMLLDLRLPGVDGWQVLATLQAEPTLQHVRVVILTASADYDEERRARASGVVEYLVKPISADGLLDAVDRALASRPT